MDKKELDKILKALISESKRFSYADLPKGEYGYPNAVPPELSKWVRRIENVIKTSFKTDSSVFLLMEKGLEYAEVITDNDQVVFNGVKDNLVRSLETALESLDSDLYDEQIGQGQKSKPSKYSNKVFIVHGHDHKSKNELEMFLKDIGLIPIVLHREADEGQTIIEKFEKHSDVGYAFVLLTPDDKVVLSGAVKSEKPRARQNVIFEFGFFVGSLGRNRVCCLNKEEVEIPSDISGLIYKAFRKDIEEIKFSIIKELKAAGYKISI